MLEGFAGNGTLSGHGVHYSVLSAEGGDLRQAWLKRLENDPWRDLYAHISVHFGFSTGWKLAQGAPLPVPYSPESLDAGRRNLEAMTRTMPCPIGLENLALAFSRRDVESQGRFLDDLLSPFDGFLLMDLHNVYCQSVNFDVDFLDLVRTYPLHRVRELHLSGGSWSEFDTGKSIRRDTHDQAVPDALFDALQDVIRLCPHLEFVFLEQVPEALTTVAQRIQVTTDYHTMKEHIHGMV